MRKHILAGIALAITAGCVPVGPGFNPGPQYASGQQIYNTLTNFSVVGNLSDGTSYCEYHGPSSQISGRDGAGFYQGTWAVAGNQVCYSYPQQNVFNDCQNVTIQGQRASFYGAGGQVISSGNLIGGNVC